MSRKFRMLVRLNVIIILYMINERVLIYFLGKE